MKRILLTGVCVLGVISAVFLSLGNSKSSKENAHPPVSSSLQAKVRPLTVNNADDAKSEHNNPNAPEPNNSEETDSPQFKGTETSPNTGEKAKTENSWQQAFNDIQSTEQFFLRDDGAVKREGLERVFKAEEFQNVIEALKLAGSDLASAQRHQTLQDYYYAQFADVSHSERFACSGRVCAASFVSTKDDSSHFSSLADFDQNYVFTRSVPNENGDVEYNIIMIETDDPSSLTVTH